MYLAQVRIDEIYLIISEFISTRRIHSVRREILNLWRLCKRIRNLMRRTSNRCSNSSILPWLPCVFLFSRMWY